MSFDFAFGLVIIAQIPVIFRAARTEFPHELLVIEFVLELTLMSFRHFVGFTRKSHTADGILVEVKDPFAETFENRLQMESCPAGSRRSHKRVGVDVQVFTLGLRFVGDFHPVFVQTADVAHIVLARIHEHLKRLRVVEHFVLHEIRFDTRDG